MAFMNIIRRSAGVAIVLLASVMLIVCLAVIAGIWCVKHRLDGIEDDLYKAADSSLAFIDERLERTEEVFRDVNKRVGLFSGILNGLPAKESDIKTEVTSLLQSLDREVIEPLRNAETWIDSTRAVAAGIGKVSEAVVTSEYAAAHVDSVGVAMAERLQSGSESLVEMLTTLQEVRQRLIDMLDDLASARKIAARTVASLADIDTKMANLRRRIEKVHAGIVEMKCSVADLKDHFHWWTTVGAILLSVLLAWFAASQISMIVHGWLTLFRSK
jgi:chromosome segregation ATPase